MKGSDRLNFWLKWLVKGYQQTLLSTILLLVSATAQAQITPDATLGGESSRVVPRALGGDSINGGAIRGSNLFHSFSEFNVGDRQRVYFANPTGTQNILTRVTGSTLSNINGTLGVDGAANLFLLNPNGIIFGQNARLDVRGSFVGSTANAIGFGNQGEFSATSPQAPSPLLTVQPSALLFTQLGAKPVVVNQASFSVAPGQRLMLIGGDIQLQQSVIGTESGKVDLATISGVGTIELDTNNSLSIPANVSRADVLMNRSTIFATGGTGGDITINSRNIDIIDDYITTGVFPGLPSINLASGDIHLNATGVVQSRGNSRIGNIVFANGLGNSGNIKIGSGLDVLLMSVETSLSQAFSSFSNISETLPQN
jgi:filamentous hemagglutinin family protein